jgi:hypothetical protein
MLSRQKRRLCFDWFLASISFASTFVFAISFAQTSKNQQNQKNQQASQDRVIRPQGEWVIEGSGDAPDLGQLPPPQEVLVPYPTDLADERSPLFLLIKDIYDPKHPLYLPDQVWELQIDGELPLLPNKASAVSYP